jgi:hypothetical protein
VDRATLTFVVRGGQILLIRKMRGLGADAHYEEKPGDCFATL